MSFVLYVTVMYSNQFRIIEISLDRLDKVIEARDGPPDSVPETNLTKRKEDKSTPKPKKQKRSSTSTTPVRYVL